MALRTYLPGLLAIMRALCAYIARNRVRIIRFVGEENTAQVDAVVTACLVLEEILVPLIPTGA